MFKLSRMTWTAVVVTIVITGSATVKRLHAPITPIRQKMVSNSLGAGKREDLSANDPTNPFSPSSAAHREAENFHAWLSENGKLDAMVSTKNLSDRLNLVSELEPKGMQKLPDESIERFIPLMGKILDSLSDKDCADLLKGTTSIGKLQNYVYPVVDSFNDEEANSWFSITRLSIDAQLDNLPVIPLSKRNARTGIFRIAASLSPNEGRLFIEKLANLRTESDANVCHTIRTIFYREPLLPEPYRGSVARMLVSGKPEGLNGGYEDAAQEK